MSTEMASFQRVEVVYIYWLLFLKGLHAVTPPYPQSSKLGFGAILDAALPVVHPIVAAGSSRCEAFKNYFGLTYEQMQEKNATNFDDTLHIDLITKNGNLKYNLTATKSIRKQIKNAKSIIVLIHGFMESSDGLMVQAVAPELLKKSRIKVLALDGRKVFTLEYFRSSTYVRFMGEKLGKILSEMINNGQDPKQITLIGHSLGSHIAGIAGKQVRQLTGKLLGRIAALDPAGPCFSSVGSAGRLDSNDATYVDVIHTNAGTLGMENPVGQKDFYPNSGMSQPGCFLYTCHHSRAWQFFAESINSPDRFPARKCENWTMFRDGQCAKNEVAYLGMNSEAGTPGIYYLSTGSSSPFGLGAAGSG